MTKDLNDVWGKLQEMDSKLDNMQGDINIQSTINKENNKETLQDLINRKFGRSKYKRLCWYYADGKRTIDELAEITGIGPGNVRSTLSEMNEQGLLDKRESEDRVYYYRAEVTEGIGIESDVEDFVDDL